jgi:acyl-CoA synthetase (AMP-forming)/AMP-acid ligase II
MNMMPLFHTGGIMRNLLAPLLAGGATVLTPGFDPSLFWDSAEKLGFTWYYAAPTMHSMLISEYERRKQAVRHRVRFIGNAAGPLLPQLAQHLRDTFG